MISFITRLFRSRPYKVDGESMIPAFNRGDHVLGELLVGQRKELSRGDVVVSERPVIAIRPGASDGSNRDLKRVVGLPDEYICLRDGLIYINEALLDEPWIAGHRSWEARGSHWVIIEGTVQIVPYMVQCHKMECWRGFGFVIGRLVPGKYSDLIYAMVALVQ